MKPPHKDPKAPSKVSAFSGADQHAFYDCSRQWKIMLGPGVTLRAAALTAGTQGQMLIASGPGVEAHADPINHELTLNPNTGSPNSWNIAVAPSVAICQTPNPAVLLATGPETSNVVGLINSVKSLIGILVSPAPPEPKSIVSGTAGRPIQPCSIGTKE
jgi:hypothetical protein